MFSNLRIGPKVTGGLAIVALVAEMIGAYGIRVLPGNATLSLVVISLAVLLFAVFIGMLLSGSITRPLGKSITMMKEIAKGNLGSRMRLDRKDEIGLLADEMDALADNLKGLIDQLGSMSKQHDLNDIDVTIPADTFEGSYRIMVQGVNDMVTGHISVKKKAMACIAEFGKGNFDALLEKFPGKKAFINENIERLRLNIKEFIAQMKHMSEQHNAGDIDVTIPADTFDGSFKIMAQGVNDMVNGHIAVKKKAMACIAEFGKGNFEAPLEKFPGKKAFINDNIEALRENLKKVAFEIGILIKAAADGELDKRANADLFLGGWKQLVSGVNDTISNIVDPLMVTADYVDKVSKGVIPPEITTVYKGQYNIIKTNLNAVVRMMSDLLKETDVIIKAAANGELDKRANADLFLGGWKQLVSGVNETIFNIVRPLLVAADYVDKISKGVIPPEITTDSKGQYNIIKTNLNSVVKMMNELLNETGGIIQAAAEGSLDKRADADRFLGGWKKLVSGVNDTITNIVNPLMVTADYVDKISKGIIPPVITAEYKGQYNIIKTNLNQCIEALNALIVEDGGKVLEAASEKDLSKRLTRTYQNQFNTMKDNINKVVESLDLALQQVAQSSEQVSSAGQQISAGSQSLAQGANEQASSLEEVSSNLEEMSSMTKQNAENANKAKNLSGEANNNAMQGKQAMSRMSDSINKIKESSDHTAKIVKTIDEIAMQTNLLALNAAVEAARAGEAGRGFAVVAEEVRNLAQRSAEAAKNTANMIEESVKNAEEGVTIAGDVAKSFDAIAGSNAKVDTLIAEIAAASQEQSQGIDQVNTAVAQMDKVTQQNAANSEESASAAEELSSQAEELQGMVAQFKLSNSGQQSAKAVIHHGAGTAHQVKPASEQKTELRNKSGNGKYSGNHGGKVVNPEEIIPLAEEGVLRTF